MVGSYTYLSHMKVSSTAILDIILVKLDLQRRIYLGTIQILRKQRGWVGGLCQMLTFADKVGGWVTANAYVSKISKCVTKSPLNIYTSCDEMY